MSSRRLPLHLALVALLAASLACNTVTRMFEGPVDDFEPPATVEPEDFPTPDVAATVDRSSDDNNNNFGNDNFNANDNANDNDAGDDNENDNGNGSFPDFGDVPEDIPIYEDGEVENMFAIADLVSYSTDGVFDDVLDFYMDEMEANGWEYDPDQSFVTQETAILVFTKDDRTATITLSEDVTSDGTLVLIALSSS